jgi:hypothetical protein
VPENNRLALPVGQAAQRGEHLTVLLAEQCPRFGGLGVRFEQGGGDLTGPPPESVAAPFSTLERA